MGFDMPACTFLTRLLRRNCFQRSLVAVLSELLAGEEGEGVVDERVRAKQAKATNDVQAQMFKKQVKAMLQWLLI